MNSKWKKTPLVSFVYKKYFSVLISEGSILVRGDPCDPCILYTAEVIPVYKKSDKLNKSNYRPVSILPILAKVFEKVLAHQIPPFLNTVFSCHLSAFRQGHGCQDTLLTLIKNWRKDLLKNHKIGALLMDLSKAFDCMPHDILIAKFKAYGVQDQSIKIIKSYLTDRSNVSG